MTAKTNTSSERRPTKGRTLKVAGLFAGIGGIELGLGRSGHESHILCEIDEAASAVLKQRFQGTRLHDDVSTLKSVKGIDFISAGFPC